MVGSAAQSIHQISWFGDAYIVLFELGQNGSLAGGVLEEVGTTIVVVMVAVKLGRRLL
jgi:hypothetical protein